MNFYELKTKLIKSLAFVPNIKTIALYGSCAYKELSEARDIDVFAVFDDPDFRTGRIDALFQGLDKKASVYVLNEKDLFDDIETQKFGAKLSTFFFHGYLPVLNEENCYRYYVAAMQSLIKTFDLTLYQDPASFFKYGNLRMYKYSSIFYKSGLDFYTHPALRNLNYGLYERAFEAFSTDEKTYVKNPDLPHVAQQFVHFFRSSETAIITNIHKKRDAMLKRMTEHRTLLEKEYGKAEFSALLTAFEQLGKDLAAVQKEGHPPLPFVCYDKIEIP